MQVERAERHVEERLRHDLPVVREHDQLRPQREHLGHGLGTPESRGRLDHLDAQFGGHIGHG